MTVTASHKLPRCHDPKCLRAWCERERLHERAGRRWANNQTKTIKQKQSNKNNKPMTAAEWAVNIAKLPELLRRT
jgi:hypothetical protein